jgi:thiamine biosynthesis lipoprotein
LELDALGTHWWIEPLSGTLGDTVESAVIRTIREFERQYTRFSDTSLLGHLNLHKRLLDPPKEMLRMLEFARDLQTKTNGVFNVSVGGELVRRGYGKTGQGKLSDSFWNEVKLTPDEIRIPGEISLDFGGFGKGWLIDTIGKLLRDNSVGHFIINGGGDILVSSQEPIELALEHPLDPSKSIGTTRIQHGALAVSSNIKRSWKYKGQQHHIIDPRTGAPAASDIISTYVRANSALLADVCATILLIAPELDQTLTQAYNLKTILLRSSQLPNPV